VKLIFASSGDCVPLRIEALHQQMFTGASCYWNTPLLQFLENILGLQTIK